MANCHNNRTTNHGERQRQPAEQNGGQAATRNGTGDCGAEFEKCSELGFLSGSLPANGILNPPRGIGGREGLKPSPTLIALTCAIRRSLTTTNGNCTHCLFGFCL
jgi:hypothetical protein